LLEDNEHSWYSLRQPTETFLVTFPGLVFQYWEKSFEKINTLGANNYSGDIDIGSNSKRIQIVLSRSEVYW
jgi:hypothetical protein